MLREIRDVLEMERQENLLKSLPNISISFGWSISTGDQGMIEDNLREAGVDPDVFNWEEASNDFDRIERNLIAILRNNGLAMRPEGHGDNDLGGTGWLNTKFGNDGSLNKIGLELMRDLVDSNEGLSTGSGSIMSLKESDKLFEGVSDVVARVSEVRFDLFDTDRLKEFFEALENGQPLDPFLGESFLAPREPSGIFRKVVDGVEIYSARCPGCKRIHGNFRTYDEAAGNRQCKFCTRDYVDKMTKVSQTGNFKHLLKKDHETRASKRYR